MLRALAILLALSGPALAFNNTFLGDDAEFHTVGAAGAVTSVTNSDGTLTISPTTGAVVASIALGHANTWTALQTIDFILSPQTTSWFSTDTPASNYIQFGDHIFGGDAINYPNNNTCGTGDWFTTFEATTSNGACAYIGTFEAVIESKTNNANAGAGLLVAGQSAHMSSATNGAFGIAAFGLENKSGAGSRTGGSTWAIYGECDKTQNNGGNCYGMELDVMTEVNVANQPDPFTQGNLVGSQIACGSGLSSPTNYHCAAAVQIVNNTQPYNVGINFINGSIANGGPNSTIVAISLPTTYQIAWFSAAATPQAGISADSAGYLDLTLANGIKVNGTASVSCASGSVNAATLVVTDGIVTHC